MSIVHTYVNKLSALSYTSQKNKSMKFGFYKNYKSLYVNEEG